MFKARMKFCKEGRAKFISHLDLMKLLQRAMSRANVPVKYTEGFNKHAYVSVALPLSTGYSSEYEILDFGLTTDKVPENAVNDLNNIMPEGIKVLEIYEFSMPVKDIKYSEYEINYEILGGASDEMLSDIITLFKKDEIELVKKTKRSEKVVNIKEFILSIEISKIGENIVITTINKAGAENLSPEYLTKAIREYLPCIQILGASYHRKNIFDENLKKFK